MPGDIDNYYNYDDDDDDDMIEDDSQERKNMIKRFFSSEGYCGRMRPFDGQLYKVSSHHYDDGDGVRGGRCLSFDEDKDIDSIKLSRRKCSFIKASLLFPA